MAKATIITKSGTKIMIEGTVDEVKQLVAAHKQNDGPDREAGSGAKEVGLKKNSVTNAILRLKKSGYFGRSRSLVEIKNALEAEGLIYPLTTLSGIFLKLVRRHALRRVEQKKKWYYVN